MTFTALVAVRFYYSNQQYIYIEIGNIKPHEANVIIHILSQSRHKVVHAYNVYKQL